MGMAVPGFGEILSNPGFETGLQGWSALWTREADAGTVALDGREFHGGATSLRIEHRGAKDWSLEAKDRLAVAPGDLVEISAWAKSSEADSDASHLTLCVASRNDFGTVEQWNLGAFPFDRAEGKAGEWRRLRSRFLVPPGVVEVQLRLIGSGVGRLWVDDLSLVKLPGLGELRNKDMPPKITLSNPALDVTLDTGAGAFTVVDRRTGETFRQNPVSPDVVLLNAEAGKAPDDLALRFTLLNAATGMKIEATLRLDPARPEFTLDLAAQGELPGTLHYPGPFLTKPGQYLVVPMNEGISYPVEDPDIQPMDLVAYGGHGICMAFWGVTDGEHGQMAILETPDDAAIRIDRHDGKLDIAPQWEPQKRQFGYPRRLRYIFFDQGGHVAMAKRYRAYAKETGLFRTLEQKRKENPEVDRLIGAVNVWCWDKNAVPFVRELKAAGIDRILWSSAQSPETLKALNDLGVLTSRYDIYQDVMDPAQFPRLRYVHSDWPTAAWPDDLVRNAGGDWVHGWDVETKDGGLYPCGVLSDGQALKYARERVLADLATHPYRCRFIDTTTASPWREDYNPLHPMTRSQCREARMALLKFISADCHLVTGSETGHDAAVPFVDYFEGMLSLGPYRVPDAGREMQRVWDEVPENLSKFQVGHAYRLPLWELVYHECVVAQWYWGDYSNKLPALWDKRDLFNVLYGTPPMFMFDRAGWDKNKERFAQSYRNVAPAVRAVGYSEMTNHRFLTLDRNVQQTTFANGTVVTVNFGSQPYRTPGGTLLAPLGFRVDQAN
ncbi:Carbohydrate binding domain-containing protein [Verrucomicrobium sp. GAS474]|uniref:glycoside hydrolase n=1 Tax=Verrucomicrobium sp. GAS474 TaxID=1882831 RepID=UPI00087A5F0D|nr:glycoside hydrolase [Verrucomicrobium sp. GAS474]SDU15621.1 Carbohydrate binding domain-containing protein [Verrucomicrobium sp. GAS474]